MKLLLLGVILLVVYVESYNQCQKWCYYVYFGKIVLNCCSCDEKVGTCPIGCLDRKGQYQLWGIACNTDHNCPFGYKCCRDDCYRFHKICKAAELWSYKEESTTSSKIPTTKTTTKIPITMKPTTVIPTTTQILTDTPEDSTPPTTTTISMATMTIPTTTTSATTTTEIPITTEIQDLTSTTTTEIPITTEMQDLTTITTEIPTTIPATITTTEIPITTVMQDLNEDEDEGSGSLILNSGSSGMISFVDSNDIDLYFQN